jgi:thiol-disulfide isomerase/thioredoxin
MKDAEDFPMRRPRGAAALGAMIVGLLAARAGAQDASRSAGAPRSRDELNASYQRQREKLGAEFEKRLSELEARRIADLADLAERQKESGEADATYRALFYQAIAHDQYDAAAKAADRYLDGDKGSPRLKALATFIKVVAAADRGDYEASLKQLEGFVHHHGGPGDPGKQLDPATIFAVGGAYLERLIQAGRYDIARKVCELAVKGHPDPAVKEHFQARLARIDMIGKPAPPIEGTDVDGEPVRLADLKGKVVLVDFWATWCAPCVAQLGELNDLYDRHRDRGFEVLGVNVDAAREGLRDRGAVRPTVRRFLIDMNVPWPVIVAGEGRDDILRAYGVTDIPALFLIDRDGKVMQFEQRGEALEKAIAKALGDRGGAREGG